MAVLLDNARKAEFELWAENAPFVFREALKRRGYRWNAQARCWTLILDETALADEEA